MATRFQRPDANSAGVSMAAQADMFAHRESRALYGLPYAAPCAPAPAVGQIAVKRSRSLAKYKQSTVAADDKDERQGVKAVEDKTFYLQDGFWIDSAYDVRKSSPLEVITFGSKRYFELLRSLPGLSKYLSVGPKVIVSYKGHVYKIVTA
jgi:hypothetical protein